ncbi:MAG: hypothetical protein E6H64_15270 [Betaproteobacteria bacterium]|nr:MAG: hypothetical protein E6H64_15270 [Betaproteobacteria bacterium]
MLVADRIDELVDPGRFAGAPEIEEGPFVSVKALDDARQRVAEAPAQGLRPQVARLEHVRVGGNDQRVSGGFHHGAGVLRLSR